MTNVRTIHVDWYSQRPPRFSGGPQLAYQGDHLSNMVVFDNAPELPNYYLLVKMKTDDAGQVVDLPAIRLEGPYWVIPNYYTQICQKITYQICCKTESGDFEHHSAKFEGTILPVIKHNGEPIDQSPMFDPYIDILDKRVDELIVAAGDIQIDSELKSDSGNPVQNRVIKAKIDEIDENAIALNGRLRNYEGIFTGNVDESVQNWLDAHPEATTTVQDGSLTEEKFSNSLKLDTIKEYVTPKMYGAVGDGVTDDTEAFQALSGKTAYIPEGTYIVSHAEFARKTTLFGAGMGKTIIKQKAGESGDLFDFVDADCSGMVNLSLIGNKSETSSDIYRALLKIRTTRDHVVDYSNYCNFEHLVIRNAPASGFVLLGRSSTDPNHPLSNHNWVHHFNDIRVEECNLWCMIDETSDNLFSNLYLNEGDLGNLYCHGSSNMYANIKIDQPYGGGGGGSLEGFDDGALVLIKNSENIRFINIDLQSARYVGAKIYNSSGIHFDGDINNCGLGANGHGIGLWLKKSNHCTFNLEMHDLGANPEHNVKIESDCFNVSVYANQRYVTENINNAQGTCFIVDPSDISNLYNSKIDTTQKMNNLFVNPLCDSLDGWVKGSAENISLDTSGKIVGTNSFKIVGDSTKTIMVYQRYTGLKAGDCYMSLAVVNIEQLPTQTGALSTMYTGMATGGKDSRIYANHTFAPRELGKHLIAQVGKISNGGDLEARFYAYKNDGVYYIGNFMLFNLTDLGIAIPAKTSTYNTLYANLKDVMDAPFDTIDVTWDYTQVMGILKYLLNEMSQ